MVSSVASEKIPSDITGDRSRDPPTSSTVAVPTVPHQHSSENGHSLFLESYKTFDTSGQVLRDTCGCHSFDNMRLVYENVI
jgi:hypothetical protein